MNNIRLRYAPSPTGYLHIGNARTALFNYLFAKHYNGSFIIRIEDTDFERNVVGAIDSQLENLEWLKIKFDESFLKPNNKFGKYKQSEKLDVYLDYVNQLIDKDLAYKCYCTSEQLQNEKNDQIANNKIIKYSGKCRELKEKLNKPYSIRFKTPLNKVIKFKDLVRGDIEFNTNEIGDFVIVKSNGVATYNFAVAIDDHDMNITHVLRGEEHLSNTPKQICIFNAFNWTSPKFGHMTLIIDEHRKKLSKRSGNKMFFISEYKKNGFLPEALFNYIALLGWSPNLNHEIFDQLELIKNFDDSRLSKSPSTFDQKKLIWINSQWIKRIDENKYLEFIKKFVDKKFDQKKYNKNTFDQILLLFKKEIEYGIEINKHLEIFYNDILIDKNTKILLEEFDYINIKNELNKQLKDLNNWTTENINDVIKNIGNKLNIKGKNLFMPIRILTTKKTHGPELVKTILLLGKQKVLKNIGE